MPSNLDILAASDFARNPFLETIVRRKRGDHTRTENVSAVVEIDSQTAQSENSDEGGQSNRANLNHITRGARIEVAAGQETHPDDVWEFDDSIWKAIGQPQGKDSGSKTIAVRDVRRNHGRQANVNTQA